MLSVINLLYNWDSIYMILESLNYGSKVQSTKVSIKEALSCANILDKEIPEDDYELKISFSRLLLANNAVNEFPDGIISREVQENVWESLRNIQKVLAKDFYIRNYEKDISELLNKPVYKNVIELMVKDYILGNYKY